MMDSFAEIYSGIYKETRNENIQKLWEILCNKSDTTNRGECLEKLKGWNLDCNEVYPNLFISNGEAARNIEFLKAVGITYIVNAAEGDEFGMVNTNADYYKESGIKYLGLQLKDIPMVSIHKHVHLAADFIEEGLNSGGKVLVHCVMGISRSSTCVIAYLMLKKRLSVEEAIQQVNNHREILPNNGFLVQLVELDKKIRSSS